MRTLTSLTQDRAMRDVLAQLEMLSHGSTQSWNPSGGHNADGPVLPPYDPPPHTIFFHRYNAAGSDQARGVVLEEARAELAHWRGHGHASGFRPSVLSDAEILRERILTEGKGSPAPDVARALRCTVTIVRKIRAAKALDEHGNDPPPLAAAADLRATVFGLAARNLSNRQIAQLAGVSARTVGRILKSAE